MNINCFIVNYIDKLGNEVIIVTGGIDDGANFDYMFVEPALKNVHDSIDGGTPKDDMSWLVVDAGYTEEQMNNFKQTADKIGINFVEVKNKDDFTDYINAKDGGVTRSEDKITEMSFFSHGHNPIYSGSAENQLSFSYGINNLSEDIKKQIDFTQSDIAS